MEKYFSTDESMGEIEFTIRLKYIILITGLLIISSLSLLLTIYADSKILERSSSVFGVGIAVLSVVYSALSLHQSNQIRKEELRIKKAEYAMDFISETNDPEFSSRFIDCIKLRDEISDKSGEELDNVIESNDEYHEALTSVLNYLERLGVLVNSGSADEKVLMDYFQSPVRIYWHAFSGWIERKRRERETQDLFCEFEKLAEKWGGIS